MAWTSLADRIDDLPLILAGPILRRTEPGSVTVWLALRESRTVMLRVYSQDNSGDLTEQLVGTQTTIRLGSHLYVVAVTAVPTVGVGIVLDAGPITGGGFLRFDHANARYEGVLQLDVYGIEVSAVGLLDTKLPGDAPGFSFLIIISAEFAPIQLGFGFTLNGVGGLAGIHRTLVVDALQAGIRNQSLDHILNERG